MDPSSSSVGFPLYGSTQSPQNSTPLPSSIGFPPSGNTQSSEIPQSTQIPSSLHPPSFSVQIPFYANPQFNPEQQLYCNGPPTLIVPDADWNRELANLFTDLNFCSFMRGGACEEEFQEWYECMYRTVYIGGVRANCSRLSSFLRDCIFLNQSYYHPLFVHFSDISRRR